MSQGAWKDAELRKLGVPKGPSTNLVRTLYTYVEESIWGSTSYLSSWTLWQSVLVPKCKLQSRRELSWKQHGPCRRKLREEFRTNNVEDSYPSESLPESNKDILGSSQSVNDACSESQVYTPFWVGGALPKRSQSLSSPC